MRISGFLLLTLCLCSFPLYAQNIELNIQDQTLDEVLIDLKEKYQLQYAADHKNLISCTINIRSTFKDLESALSTLVKLCSLDYTKEGEVYVLYYNTSVKYNRPPKKYSYKFQVLDESTGEKIAYAHSATDHQQFMTDENGRVNFVSQDSSIELTISHLGYVSKKVSLRSDKLVIVKLSAVTTELKIVEVVANKKKNETISLFKTPSEILIHDRLISLMPGNGNNTLFTLMRMESGVLASSEQYRDYIIWGSYKGQTNIIYDGITLFNTISYKPNLEVLNPLMVQNIRIYKAAYQVDIGDRVGGFVDVSSKSGRSDSSYTNIHIDNQSIALSRNFKIKGRSNFQSAFRMSYADLFRPETYSKDFDFGRNVFADLHLKYNLSVAKNDLFKVAFIGSIERSAIEFKDSGSVNNFFDRRSLQRYQIGGIIHYKRAWFNGAITDIKSTYARMSANNTLLLSLKDSVLNGQYERNIFTINTISELKISLKHSVPVNRLHALCFGLDLIYHHTNFFQDTISVDDKRQLTDFSRLVFYLKDQFFIHKYFSIEPGLRIEFPFSRMNVNFQPRINLKFYPHKKWTLYLAYGMHTQYLQEVPLVDLYGNYNYYWLIDKENSPLNAMHYVAGLSVDYGIFSFQTNGFYKSFNNLKRYYSDSDLNFSLSHGDGYSYGIDFFAKAQFFSHQYWVSYAWTHSMERFGNVTEYQRALHDQRHELKLAALFQLGNFNISTNYVFGTGFPYADALDSEENIQAYHRWDIGLMYEKKFKKVNLEFGCSVLNVLNIKNIQFGNFSALPGKVTQYQLGIPITPTFFTNINF